MEGLPFHPGTPEQPSVGTPPSGAPIPPGAPTHPIVQGRSRPHAAERAPSYETRHEVGHEPRYEHRRETPRAWGRPPETTPRQETGRSWSTGQNPVPDSSGAYAAVPEAQDAYPERRDGPSPAGQPGPRETGGVEVRLRPRANERKRARERERERERERRRGRRARRRTGRRGPLAVAGVLVLVGLVTIGLVLTQGAEGADGTQAGEAGSSLENVELPPAGTPVEVGTADGFRDRLAAVSSGLNEEAVTASQATLPSGTSFPYIDYLLTNPTNKKVLLEYPGDIFVRRDHVAPSGRARCEPQAGVPDSMCTPPTWSKVVRRLRGGELISGEGGDKYMAPGATYLVRVTVEVPVKRNAGLADIRLYVWRQLYMADKPAKPVPFPKPN